MFKKLFFSQSQLKEKCDNRERKFSIAFHKQE